MIAIKNISLAVIRRLPRYYRYLTKLNENGVKRISSGELSKLMNITASQIRQDLNNFGGFGQQGYGYSVPALYAEIEKILGITETHNLIIIGAGNLGRAIANYKNFGKRNFNITAMFDNNPQLIGENDGVNIYDIAELPDYISQNRVDIAVLTLPEKAAADIAKIIAERGVKAVWNFSGADLSFLKGVTVEYVHLMDSLMTLSYMMGQ